MADKPRVVGDNSFNPYHYSFALCAENRNAHENFSNTKRPGSSNHGPMEKRPRRMPGYEHYFKSDAEFHCDRCDRSFRSKAQYDAHVSEHITCGREGCQFTAHPKVVENHVRMQHDTGLYQKIGKLSNSVDITKWIAERKKKYPSLKNKAEKQTMDVVKENRGERVKPETGRFSHSLYKRERKSGYELNGQRGQRQQRPTRSRGRKARERKAAWKNPVQGIEAAETGVEEWNGDIPPFRGTGFLEATEDEDEALQIASITHQITDDEEESQTTEPCKQPEHKTVPINKALGLLIASYGSDASEDEAPREERTVRSKTPPIVEPAKETDKEQKPNSVAKQPDRRPQKKNVRDDARNSRGNDRNGRRFITHPRKPTLLERLLHSEIIHERNVILQCVRYVIRNDFFGIGKKIKDERTEE